MQFKVGVIGATGYIGALYRQEIRESDAAAIVALCARRTDLLAAAGAEDGYFVQLFTDAAARSAQTGHWVQISAV